VDTVERTAFNNLALAIVRQAVDDWRDLCSGNRIENRVCNFRELEYFFKKDCFGCLDGTNISPERVYKRLLLERKLANKNKAVV